MTHSHRLTRLNIIAGVSSKGDVYYSINYGRTNSLTFGFFLGKLVDYLNGEDNNWRDHTILMLDNA